MVRISKSDLFGIFYVKKPNGSGLPSYYATIDALRPLFDSEEFNAAVKGFYLNICGDSDAVRISYFVDQTNIKDAVSIFATFFQNKGLIEIQKSAEPREEIVARSYGGAEFEERFRNFLVLETKIGLDLIKGIYYMQEDYLRRIVGKLEKRRYHLKTILSLHSRNTVLLLIPYPGRKKVNSSWI